MGFSFGSPSKSATNSTTINESTNAADNSISAQTAGVIETSGGGALSHNEGQINSGGGSITLTDPNAFSFASDLIHSVLGANSQTVANASAGASNAAASLGAAALNAARPPAAGAGTSAWLKWAAIVGGGMLVLGAIAIAVMRRRRRS